MNDLWAIAGWARWVSLLPGCEFTGSLCCLLDALFFTPLLLVGVTVLWLLSSSGRYGTSSR